MSVCLSLCLCVGVSIRNVSGTTHPIFIKLFVLVTCGPRSDLDYLGHYKKTLID